MNNHTVIRFGPLCLLSALAVSAFAALASAQSTDPDIQRLQAEKERAQLEAEIAKAEKDKAEAEAAAARARLGSVTTANLPQGKVTTEDVVIEGSYLAYLAATSAAKVIASKVPCTENLFFFSSSELGGIQALDALEAQVSLVSSGKDDLVKSLELKRVSSSVLPVPAGQMLELYRFEGMAAPAVAPPALFAGIDAGLSLLSLFKTDTAIQGTTVSADDTALQALVAQQWIARCSSANPKAKAILPAYAYPHIETDPAKNALVKKLSDFSKALNEVNIFTQNLTDRVQTPVAKAVEGLRKLVADARDTSLLIPVLEARLKTDLSEEQKKKVQAELSTARKHLVELTANVRAQYDTSNPLPAPGRSPYSEAELGGFLEAYLTDQLRLDVRAQALKALQTKMSGFVAALTKPDDNGVTPLAALLRAQALKGAKTDGATLLHVHFVAVGGNGIVKRNVFSSSLRFSGGVVAEYLLADQDGYLVNSGVISCYGGQLKESEIGRAFPENRVAGCTEAVP